MSCCPCMGLHRLQVVVGFNVYMTDLLEHERRCIEAEENGQQAPDPPPIPSFKPYFDKGFVLGLRETAVTSIKKIYEFVTIRRVGLARAESLLRDSKAWIRDVLAFKHR